MKILEYFEPIKLENIDINPSTKQNKYSFFHIDKNIKGNKIQEISEYVIAILGVPENRNSPNKGCEKAPNAIRKKLYDLNFSYEIKIIDLGNLQIGKSLKDTYIALQDIIAELIENKVIPLIIGGGQDLTYGNFLAYQKLNQLANLVSVDPKFDIGFIKDDFDANSFLGQIILDCGEHLFNYTNLGYQSYYINQKELKLLNKLSFDTYRLGKIRADIKEVEPVLRDADILSIDMSSVKQSEAPAHKTPSPNGFYSEEICQIARYAGISNKLTSFGLYELNPEYDNHDHTASLAAQIIWYFIEGVYLRQTDNPFSNIEDYTKFIVNFEKENQNLVFYHNKLNDRWWLEVSHPVTENKKQIIACSYHDYQIACNQELPDRWIRTIQKLR